MIWAILSANSPDTFYQIRVTWSFGSEELQNMFQDGGHGGHLGVPIETIFASFYLKVTLILPLKFRVNYPSAQENKRKIDFQDGGHFGFPTGTILIIFI